MKLGRILAQASDGPEPRIVAVWKLAGQAIDVRRLRLERSVATTAAAARIAHTVVPGIMTAALEAGQAFIDAAIIAAADADADVAVSLADRPLIAPPDPPSLREFRAVAEHFETANRINDLKPSEVLYGLAVSYLANQHALTGPEEEMPWPSYSQHMDYELEPGIVIGKPGRDSRPRRCWTTCSSSLSSLTSALPIHSCAT